MTKVLISLRGACACWYAPLLFANHRRQVFSCQGPVDLRKYWDKQCGPKSECSYIVHLIWVHTACKKATFYFSKRRQIYIDEHGSLVECVTRDRLHVLTRLIVCEYVYLPVDLAV